MGGHLLFIPVQEVELATTSPPRYSPGVQDQPTNQPTNSMEQPSPPIYAGDPPTGSPPLRVGPEDRVFQAPSLSGNDSSASVSASERWSPKIMRDPDDECVMGRQEQPAPMVYNRTEMEFRARWGINSLSPYFFPHYCSIMTRIVS